MDRLGAEWRQFVDDRVSTPGEATVWGYTRDASVKVYNAISGVVPAALGILSDNQFEVVPRTNPVAATQEAVRSTIKARWFKKGNPLNIIPKGIAAFTEVSDGVIKDALHIGGSKNGVVVRTAA